jgi:hypothetical protein
LRQEVTGDGCPLGKEVLLSCPRYTAMARQMKPVQVTAVWRRKTWVRMCKMWHGEWEGVKKTYSSFHSQSVLLTRLLLLWECLSNTFWIVICYVCLLHVPPHWAYLLHHCQQFFLPSIDMSLFLHSLISFITYFFIALQTSHHLVTS